MHRRGIGKEGREGREGVEGDEGEGAGIQQHCVERDTVGEGAGNSHSCEAGEDETAHEKQSLWLLRAAS